MTAISPLHGAIPPAANAFETHESVCCGGNCEAHPYGNLTTFEILERMGIPLELRAREVNIEIGLALLWLAEDAVHQWKGSLTGLIQLQKRQRDFNRVINLLKTTGAIPEVAVIKTEHLSICVNAVTAAHEGFVLSGPYAEQRLHQLSASQIKSLTRQLKDPETNILLEAWLSLTSAAHQ